MSINRYLYSKKIKSETGVRYYTTTFYPHIEKLNNDNYIISDSTTRLDLLANQYYDDSELYWIIAICNNIQGSIFVEPGTQLCIPNRSRIGGIISQLNALNNI